MEMTFALLRDCIKFDSLCVYNYTIPNYFLKIFVKFLLV